MSSNYDFDGIDLFNKIEHLLENNLNATPSKAMLKFYPSKYWLRPTVSIFNTYFSAVEIHNQEDYIDHIMKNMKKDRF